MPVTNHRPEGRCKVKLNFWIKLTLILLIHHRLELEQRQIATGFYVRRTINRNG